MIKTRKKHKNKKIKKQSRSRYIRGGDNNSNNSNSKNSFSDIENNIYNLIINNTNSKFKLGFTIKDKHYSTIFVYNGKSIENGCITLELFKPFKQSNSNEYLFDSHIKANRGKEACFEPRLETIEKPVRITSTDVLQVLSTKLKVLINKKSSSSLKNPISIGDVATINGVYISPYKILRGDPPIYEKYGYKNKEIDNIRKDILPQLKWGGIRDKLHIKVKEIIEKYNPMINDNDNIIQLMKNVPFEEEQKSNISTYILYSIIGYIDSYDILDIGSAEWKKWDKELVFTNFEIL